METCRNHGISPATFYKYKARTGSLWASGSQRPKSYEDEKAELKKLLAEAMLVSYSPTLGQIVGGFKLLPAPADRFGLR